MKLPRDISGETLVKALNRLGYRATRQRGGHVRLTHSNDREHNATIPLHSSLRVGMLNAILRDVAEHLGVTKEELAQRLFG